MTRAIWMMTGLLLLAPGCRPTGTVQCQDSTNCDLSSGGVCLANFGTERQWCGYPDTECPTGLRWSELDVGDGVSGRCVEPRVLDKTPPVVASKSPSPDTQQVAPSTLVTITFSEAMDPDSVTASTLRLEDQAGNLVDSLIVTNGTEVVMTPRPALDPRLEYRVTVTPEVTDVAGNGVVEPVSWTFRTRDAAWSTPVFLEQEQSKKAAEVAVAAAAGMVVAAWVYHDCATGICSMPDEVWAAVRKGGIWGAPVKLGVSVDTAHSLLIGVNASGQAVVLWGQSGIYSPGKMYEARYDSGRWSAAMLRVQDRDRSVHPLQLVDRGDGSTLLLWADLMQPYRTRFWVQAYMPIAGWADPHLLGTNLGGDFSWPSMSVAGTTASVIWEQESFPNREILSSSLRETGWTAPTSLVVVPPKTKFLGISAADDEAIAFWGTDHVTGRRFSNAGWEASVQVDRSDSPAPIKSYERSNKLQRTTNGGLLALWATDADVWQSARPSGQGWGPPIAIDNDAGPATDLQLVAGGRRALAAWRTSDIWFNEYGESVGWRGAALVEAQATAVADAAVAYDAATNTFVAVWSQANAAGVPDVLSATYR